MAKTPSRSPIISFYAFHRDVYVRYYAAEVLGNIGDERAVKCLIQTLKEKDCEVRREATWALNRIREPQ